jgi:ribonuclease-3
LASSFFDRLIRAFLGPKDQQYQIIVDLLGFRPKDYSLYKTALRHSSVIYTKKLELESNERLEFLGDAVLDLVVSEKLYYEFPDKNEGDLTKLRVKLVNRSFLNEVSIRIGLPSLLHQYVGKKKDLLKTQHNIYGNGLEAFIGAIYVDRGLVYARKFIEHRLFEGEAVYDIIFDNDKDFKSKLVSWCQRKGFHLDFLDEVSMEPELFTVRVAINGEKWGQGIGRRKKVAHQRASENTIQLMEKKGYRFDEELVAQPQA